MKTSKFKMTELGPIPEGWEVKRLGDLFELSAAGDLQSECSSRVKTDINIHPIYSNGLENAGLYGYTSKPRYKADSITITGRGTLGHAEYRTVDFDAIIRLIVMKPSERLDGRYVTFQINYCAPFHFEITSIPQLTVPQVAQALIPVPPLPEQERIAEALSDVDALLSAMTTLIEKKRAIKQGAMQQLLTGKTRLRGFGAECAEFKQTELGPIPRDWDVKRLGEIALLITKGTTPTSVGCDFESYGINFIKAESISDNGDFIPEKFAHIDEHTDMLLSRSRLREGDFLFSIAGVLGRVAVVTDEVLPANTNQALAVIRLDINSTIDKRYLFFALKSEYLRNRIKEENVAAAQANLSLQDVNEFHVAVPTLAEQKAIAAVLSDMDAEIAALEAKRAKYESIKQGMMQELLTGKTRLS